MRRLRAAVRAAAATTPGRFRLWSVALAAALAATALAGSLAAAGLVASADRLRRNTGPVLVAAQLVSASLAEADAAATAAFLSGRDEDPEQRRLYEQALGRAVEQAEEVSALIGDDAGLHRDLQAVSVLVIRYAGLVEAARAGNRAGVDGSEQYLLEALDLLAGEISDRVAAVTAASETRLRRDSAGRSTGVVAAIAVGAVALLLLVVAQAGLAARTRRLVNPLLLLATLLVAGTLGWTGLATVRSEDRLDAGRRDGYRSIALTARIARAAYGARADETVALIGADASRRAAATRAAATLAPGPLTADVVEQARRGVATGEGLFLDAVERADTDRERAGVAELLVRWQRYADTVADLREAPTAEEQRALAVGPASSTFNGFNFSLEAVLGDNRAQFLGALDRSAHALRGMTLASLVLPLLAAAAALAGYQVRINEYR